MNSVQRRHSTEATNRGLLRERAYTELKSRILGGNLDQAPFLSTRGLATELGVSLSSMSIDKSST